ncbi:MAG: hypothetical protein HRT77_03125 [Halioglobus sp.]|nr:hypothetical protein [Halioglobus sp.]
MKAELSDKDYEQLSQYLDGELDDAQVRELSARLLSEQDLRAVYERMKGLQNRLQEAVSGADTVPLQLRQSVERAATRQHRGRQRTGWGVAVAASVLLAAGVLMTVDRVEQPDDGMRLVVRDRLLTPALERQPSRGNGWETLTDGSQLRVVLSFPSVDGSWCREYLLAQENVEWRGVACREEAGRWVTAVRVAGEHRAVDGYRPAGVATPDEVATYINRQAADIPLSREQEAALIARDWQ